MNARSDGDYFNRDTFTKEMNKIKRSKTSGVGTDNVYYPKWRYFKIMQFIKSFTKHRSTVSNWRSSAVQKYPPSATVVATSSRLSPELNVDSGHFKEHVVNVEHLEEEPPSIVEGPSNSPPHLQNNLDVTTTTPVKNKKNVEYILPPVKSKSITLKQKLREEKETGHCDAKRIRPPSQKQLSYEMDREILKCLKSSKPSPRKDSISEDDPIKLYCLSLVRQFRKLSHKNQRKARIRIGQLLRCSSQMKKHYNLITSYCCCYVV